MYYVIDIYIKRTSKFLKIIKQRNLNKIIAFITRNRLSETHNIRNVLCNVILYLLKDQVYYLNL